MTNDILKGDLQHKILVVERIHQAGEKMLAEKAQLVYPKPQNREGILAVIGDVMPSWRATP